ncbi:MAG TPA: MIP family channel protein [Candidatus Acidoferrales bacterium]
MYTLTQKLCAEFIGTFAVIFFATGAICADEYLRSTGQGAITTLGLALAYGLAVGVMVTAVAHISGGHLNPAVTIGFWVTKRLSTTHTILYWIVQLAGAVAAAYLISAIIPDDAWRLEAMNAINPSLAPDFTRLHGMVLEGILTFVLVFVFFATMVDVKGAFNKIAGFGVGLAVTMDTLFGYPLTHAALNPARAFGPALATRHWSNHGVYWVGPLLGGVLASVIYDRIFLVDQPPL